MTREAKRIAAGEFKAKCLDVLDRVERTKEPIIVTKRGRPVAQVVPIPDASKATLRGSVTFLGDIVAPLGETWDVEL